MDELETEKKRLTEQHSRELKTLEEAAEEKQKQLTETRHLTIQDLTNRHEQDLLAAKQRAEDELTNLRQVLCHICYCGNAYTYALFCFFVFGCQYRCN